MRGDGRSTGTQTTLTRAADERTQAEKVTQQYVLRKDRRDAHNKGLGNLGIRVHFFLSSPAIWIDRITHVTIANIKNAPGGMTMIIHLSQYSLLK